MTQPLQAAILPPRAGWDWIIQGYRLFWRQPAAMIFWSVVTSFLINLGAAIPIIGQVVLVSLTPLLTFVTLCACQKLESGIRMLPGMWLAPLKEPGIAASLLRLGLLYLGCTFTAAFVSILPFWPDLLAAIGDQGQPDLGALGQAMLRPLILFGLLYVVLSALFWHTPALVGWHRLPIRRALFYSMVACWRNKWAILLYVAFWAALLYGMHWILQQLAAGGMSQVALGWLSLPVDIVLTALLYCSFYPIYTSIFQSASAASSSARQPGQSQ